MPEAPSFEQLLAVVGELSALSEEQAALIGEQAGVIEGLRVQVAELQARLAQSSRNSSVPPSADGLAKPAPKSRRTRTGRKPGGQPGHPGRTLRQVANPDEVVVHEPLCCAGCGGGLADDSASEVGSTTRWTRTARTPRASKTGPANLFRTGSRGTSCGVSRT